MALDLTKLTAACGAEVHGLDLLQRLDQATIDTLAAALGECSVLFFRDQNLTPPQHKALGECFGELHLNPAWPNLVPGHPEIMEIYTDQNSTHIAGEYWHSDVSCDPQPPLGTILYMIEVPPVGGDTLFASAHAAYEALSTPIKRLLEPLTAIHDGEPHYRGRYDRNDPEPQTYPQAEHPVIRTHPVTGRNAIFVNRTFTTRIVQLTARESDAMLNMLFHHLEQPQFQCRFKWEKGSVAFWDNRCALHNAMWDYYPHRRRGHRVTIIGETPYYQSADEVRHP